MKKILILSADPSDTPRLRLGDEVREIRDALERSKNRDQFEIIDYSSVRVDDLQHILQKYTPKIVHFSGHGGGTHGLVLQNEQSQKQHVSSTALANLFKMFKEDVECVFLNACMSEEQANAIHQHIDCVVGMNQNIKDAAAIKFAKGFYSSLGHDKTYKEAFEFGCNSIELHSIPDVDIPVIKLRTNGNPKTLSPLTELEPSQDQVPKSSELINPSLVPDLETPEGVVRLGSRFYIASPYEGRCEEEITKPGSLIRINSPDKMGKSSLMVRLLDHATQHLGYRTVAIDLRQTNQKFFHDLDKFMQWFCASVGKQLGIKVKPDEYWDDMFGANDNSSDYFEKYLLDGDDIPLVLAIDNFDRVFHYADIETDFCGLLRGWHERSRNRAHWGNLRLVIVYSQEPFSQKDINQSPFNVGLPIGLGEFTAEQVRDLVARHGLGWSEAQIGQVMQLVGGHPYLVRLALYHIAVGDVSITEFLQTASTEAGIYRNHLLGHLRDLEEYPDLGTAMQRVVTSDRPIRLRSEIAFLLDSMGLVERVENNVKSRCLLYRQYFCDRLGARG